ncbi:hypothetical protein [Olsenella profusa]|uniref:Macrophage migration inhibitory factor (MIF) n=1 Tax=Olsenella profusa TaxID=138595 RepID=A0ABS2F1H1_9ACTN|nr:hypothetical protein [Olsenella profusa]MBM6774841.1 hypothetical protein [Olsenella profusa]
MPVVHTHCSEPISPEAREALKAAYGRAIEVVPGKSESWLMCLFEGDVPIYFAGDDSAPAAYVEVSVFARDAVDAGVWERFTEEVTPAIARELGVDPARLYIRYGWTPDFGWNGANF